MWIILTAALLCGAPTETESQTMDVPRLYPALEAYIQARSGEFDRIDPQRRALLDEIAAYVRAAQSAAQPVKITFICTHNSRRSHMSQLWASAAAAHFGVPNVRTYSGGTEATAFNPRAVNALRRAGFEIEKTSDDANPVYLVRLSGDRPPEIAFSKVFHHAPNPQADFLAVLTCGEADRSCPAVPGAARRVALTYVDPKSEDDTPREAAAYDERCAQIAREMLYAFSRVAVAADE